MTGLILQRIVLISLLVFTHFAAQAQMSTPANVLDGLAQKAFANGKIRIIVGLVREEDGKTDPDSLATRAEKAREKFFKQFEAYLRMKGTNLSKKANDHKIGTFSHSPAVSIWVDADELKAIRNFDEVISIVESFEVRPSLY